MAFAPTDQQQDFLDAIENTDKHLALVARAGCGKTSTIILGVDTIRRVNPQAEVLVCAFNKSIATEVEGKLREAGHTDWRKVQTSTLHGLGLKLLKYAFNLQKDAINANKVRDIIRNRNGEIYVQYQSQIARLVMLAKDAAFGFFHQVGDYTSWAQLADHHGIDDFDDTSELDDVIAAAQSVYSESLADVTTVDFADMILFPLVKNLRVRFGKDFVIVDEAQDLSPARQALIRKFVKPHGGRMIVVGDDRQAIYGFTGADAQALPNLIETLDATVLPLSVTWRCPKSVVALANRLVPDIEAASAADEGEVIRAKELPDDLKAGDAVLCRNVAPLIELAYKLIWSGKSAKVEGRNIGEGLTQLAKRWKVTTVDALLKKLDLFEQREVQKAMAKNDEAKAEQVVDRVDTMREICRACIEQKQTAVSDVVAFIDRLFADGVTGQIVLASYHRSKGREWDRVVLWEHSTRCPSKAARQPWQRHQENNLAYVAITRAKKTLVLVK